MTETVKRYTCEIPIVDSSGQAITSEETQLVLATDYARLEQECDSWKLTAAGEMDRRDEMQSERDAALNQAEGLREALTAISAMQSHECTIGQSLKDAVRVAREALSAKPCAPTK